MLTKYLLSAILFSCLSISAANSLAQNQAMEQLHVNGVKMKEDKTNQESKFLYKGLNRRILKDQNVISAIERVPRHLFVAEDYREEAYEDRALPLNQGQTISQPFIVALMTQEAKICANSKVLEIGTGSGFQAAVLAELGADVYTIELVPELAKEAKERLHNLGYNKIHLRHGDGTLGWQDEAPFDAVIITAAASKPPANLLSMLKDGGRMVIPIKEKDGGGENLTLLTKNGSSFSTENLGYVRFVPLVEKES